MALILPRRIYFKKVGFEILKYWIASSLVRTESLLMDDIGQTSAVRRFASYVAKQ